MRRFCFLLLAFLFPLQLFAGTLESMVADVDAKNAIVCSAGVHMHSSVLPNVTVDVASPVATPGDDQYSGNNSDSKLESKPDSKQLKAQADLEDQTLPAPLATLPLDWHPFPHLYPHVNYGTSAFIDLQRPPPSV